MPKQRRPTVKARVCFRNATSSSIIVIITLDIGGDKPEGQDEEPDIRDDEPGPGRWKGTA
jgi:hypothetical protein